MTHPDLRQTGGRSWRYENYAGIVAENPPGYPDLETARAARAKFPIIVCQPVGPGCCQEQAGGPHSWPGFPTDPGNACHFCGPSGLMVAVPVEQLYPTLVPEPGE